MYLIIKSDYKTLVEIPFTDNWTAGQKQKNDGQQIYFINVLVMTCKQQSVARLQATLNTTSSEV